MLACLGLGSKKSSKAKKAQANKWTREDNSASNKDSWRPEDSDDELDLTPSTSHGSESSNDPHKLFACKENAEDKLVAVIVTISEGSSFDPNFSEMEPQTVPGERVSTYAISCLDVGKLHGYLAGHEAVPPAPSAWWNLIEDVRSVPADSVTLNWECCSGCSDSGFPGRSGFGSRRSQRAARSGSNPTVASPTMKLMGLALSSGYTAMCSDFSMKALISEWSEEHLGPNPFMKMSVECSEQFQLDFIPEELQNEEVPQQLQVVGELCAEQGKAVVQAMGGTIVYTLNPHRPHTSVYDLKVLTVVSDWGLGNESLPEAMKCSVGSGTNEKRGAAGHVTLTYSSGGGQLLTSMGHWIELTRIDTSLEAVARVAAHNFGEAERHQFTLEHDRLSSDTERRDHLQSWSKQMVQKSVPTRMKFRTKC